MPLSKSSAIWAPLLAVSNCLPAPIAKMQMQARLSAIAVEGAFAFLDQVSNRRLVALSAPVLCSPQWLADHPNTRRVPDVGGVRGKFCHTNAGENHSCRVGIG